MYMFELSCSNLIKRLKLQVNDFQSNCENQSTSSILLKVKEMLYSSYLKAAKFAF